LQRAGQRRRRLEGGHRPQHQHRHIGSTYAAFLEPPGPAKQHRQQRHIGGEAGKGEAQPRHPAHPRLGRGQLVIEGRGARLHLRRGAKHQQFAQALQRLDIFGAQPGGEAVDLRPRPGAEPGGEQGRQHPIQRQAEDERERRRPGEESEERRHHQPGGERGEHRHEDPQIEQVERVDIGDDAAEKIGGALGLQRRRGQRFQPRVKPHPQIREQAEGGLMRHQPLGIARADAQRGEEPHHGRGGEEIEGVLRRVTGESGQGGRRQEPAGNGEQAEIRQHGEGGEAQPRQHPAAPGGEQADQPPDIRHSPLPPPGPAPGRGRRPPAIRHGCRSA